jgi:stearoyl-CoA desaturase (delta-9 desaturase)
MRDNRVIRSRYLHRLQRRHFIIFDVAPFLGALVALGLLFYRPIGAVEISLFFGMWLLTGLGLTVGYHRLFTHRAFSTGVVMSCIFIVMGSMAGRGSMISWVAMHRRHHELSDHEGDLHSPNLHGTTVLGRLKGFLHAHLIWMIEHDYPNVAHYVPDLMAERALVAVNRLYYTWVVLGLVIPTLIGGVATESVWGAIGGFLWGGVVRLFVVEQSMSAINSLMHSFGTRRFVTRDDNSRNSGVIALLAWGEGWHNNHLPIFGRLRASLVRVRCRVYVDTIAGGARSRVGRESSQSRKDRTAPDASGNPREAQSRRRGREAIRGS